MPAPTPATDAELAALVMEVLKDPAAYRRFFGRLRPRLVGRPHPRRRLPSPGRFAPMAVFRSRIAGRSWAGNSSLCSYSSSRDRAPNHSS